MKNAGEGTQTLACEVGSFLLNQCGDVGTDAQLSGGNPRLI